MSPRLSRRRFLGRPALVPLSLIVVATCGEGPTASDVQGVAISPAAGLAVGLGSDVRFSASTIDRDGNSTATNADDWTVTDSGIATIDGSGLASAISEGVTTVTATVAGVSASATLEVFVPAEVTEYLPGTSYLGRNGYAEYIPGSLPVILSAPHGGSLTPAEIPDRTFGVTGGDRNTAELTLAVREALVDATGHAPHVIISHLHRVKLDPNREIVEAAQEDAFAERAWEEFQEFIETARVTVTGDFGGGMYFDMHGHGHQKNRLELGYLLGSDRLNGPDASLNALSVVEMTSVREIGRTRAATFSEVLRGAKSLGGFLEAQGVPVLPSPSDPQPMGDPYFTGGYNTRRHGSFDDTELVSGIQIEHHFPGVRDTDQNRRAYAARLAAAIRSFVIEYFGFFEPVP